MTIPTPREVAMAILVKYPKVSRVEQIIEAIVIERKRQTDAVNLIEILRMDAPKDGYPGTYCDRGPCVLGWAHRRKCTC